MTETDKNNGQNYFMNGAQVSTLATLGQDNFVHFSARIGPLVRLKDRNIVEEFAIIGETISEDDAENKQINNMIHVGTGNRFGVGVVIGAGSTIGDNNIFHHKCVIGPNTNIGDNNVIASGVVVTEDALKLSRIINECKQSVCNIVITYHPIELSLLSFPVNNSQSEAQKELHNKELDCLIKLIKLK